MLINGITPIFYEVELDAGERDKDNYFAIMSEPTAIDLLAFNARQFQEGVLISWTTATETKSLGFEIWIGTQEGPVSKVSSLIITQNAIGGATYEFLAQGSTEGIYWLREIDVSLVATDYGPALIEKSDEENEESIATFDLKESGIYLYVGENASEGGVELNGVALRTHLAQDGVVFYAPEGGEVELVNQAQPERMLLVDAAPVAGAKVMMLVSENGKAEITLEEDTNLLVDGLSVEAVVLDVTKPMEPVALSITAPQAVDSSALYLHGHGGSTIKIQDQ